MGSVRLSFFPSKTGRRETPETGRRSRCGYSPGTEAPARSTRVGKTSIKWAGVSTIGTGFGLQAAPASGRCPESLCRLRIDSACRSGRARCVPRPREWNRPRRRLRWWARRRARVPGDRKGQAPLSETKRMKRIIEFVVLLEIVDEPANLLVDAVNHGSERDHAVRFVRRAATERRLSKPGHEVGVGWA